MRYSFSILFSFVLLFGTLHAQDKGSIHWFEGTTDQAFETAEKQKKPVFLYWGAKWCPPCNQLKATLFKHPAFIHKTRLFIPVYLDGDTQQAQAQGEKFNVLGYPTLIIFNPQGEEITRIPGGMDLARYTEVLDFALNNIQPVKQLLDRIMEQEYKPTDREIQLLAFYSWQQDAGQATTDRDKLKLYRKLSQLTPEHMSEENSHFNAEYLLELTKLEEEPMRAETSLEAMRRLSRIIDNPINTRSNLQFVVYDGKEVISKLTANSAPARKHMANKWEKSLNRLADSGQLTTEERLTLHRGMVELYKLKEQPLPASLKRQIRYAIETAMSAVDNDYQRIALTYSGYSLLHASEQDKEAKKLLTQALKYDSNSHYWMLILAGMAKDDEQKEEAIELYRQAYAMSTGFATRLQWSSYYIDGLCKLQPENTPLIKQLIKELIVTLKQQQAPFHGRNNRVLKRIDKALSDWAKTPPQEQIAQHFHTQISSLCLKQNSEEVCAALKND